jgi:hypothetical protein
MLVYQSKPAIREGFESHLWKNGDDDLRDGLWQTGFIHMINGLPSGNLT